MKVESSEVAAAGSDRDSVDYGDIGSDIVISAAEAMDCEVFYPDEVTLTLDIDTDKDFRFFIDQFFRLRAVFGLIEYQVLKSRHGNRHVLVTMKEPRSMSDRLLLQAVLGSDRIREALSLLRLQREDPHSSILLRPREVSNG
jgi:hypothetical protein